LIAFGIDWSRSHGKSRAATKKAEQQRKQSDKESKATKKAEQQEKQSNKESRAAKKKDLPPRSA
jgi:hypothetical protein